MTSTARICKVLYFAWVREKMGRAEEQLEIPSSVDTVADLITWLKHKGGAYAIALEDENTIRVALDKTHAPPKTKIGTASEIALFPPVTGG